ncbi:MAG TPA: AMP-binding protein [Gammaproteobacteria bacterium]|nr:AMP-binding protein [Gammaproteobacteria bacterium]
MARQIQDQSADLRTDALLGILRQLASELHPNRAPPVVTLDTQLERELGLDSLGRIELMLRLEQRFNVAIPEDSAMDAQTPRALLAALDSSAISPPVPPGATVPSPAAPARRIRVPHHAATLVETLDWYAEGNPDGTYVQIYDDVDTVQPITYQALRGGAELVAGGLRERGVEPGDCVAIMLPTGADFFFAYYGILLAGAVPVPIYPPVSRSRLEDHLRRQSGILDNARARLLISTDAAKPVSRILKAQLPQLRAVCTAEELKQTGHAARVPSRTDQLALIQYTSGSTGQPKGVTLTHGNLLANVRAMGEASKASSDDVFVSWLPLYHDMGLIGACFGSLYHGIPLVLMSPLAFIGRPQRWLRAIHRHRGTMSAAPNFAYDLCARRLTDADLQGLDLSGWRLAFNGAEPVHPDTLERFCERFAPYGFARQAMTPVYGLAEDSVGLAFPPLGRGPHIDRVRRDRFVRDGVAEPAGDDDIHALRFVACGQALPGHEIRIVDSAGREVPDRRQGHLQFRGPSATGGYYRNPEATSALFHDGWLDSGDYAYAVNGEVYVTGRAKDLIIRAGRNIYPYELEQAVGQLNGIRKDAVAVFASSDPDSGRDRLVVLAESRERRPEKRAELHRRIESLSMELVDVTPDDIVLAPPRTVLKTSSGKIRRSACRELYERGELGKPLPVWRQYARLMVSGIGPEIRRGLRLLGDYIYAGYAWSVFALAALLSWTTVLLLPTRRARQRAVRFGARLAVWLTATPLTVRGREHLPKERPFVLVANHSSYLDAVVLTAVLDRPVAYVAKGELRQHFFARVMLDRLGTRFVERFDLRRSVKDTEALLQSLRTGCSLVFFPEGTFTRAAGLRPFRSGAFVVAAQGGTPVVPVAIRGTRAMLRGDTWFPRRGRLQVTINPPLEPTGTDWRAATELHHRARAEILTHCGEPDLVDAALAVPATRNGS